MDDDTMPPTAPMPPQSLTERRPGTGAGAAGLPLDAVIPLQPLSGQPIADGSEALAALRDRALDAERGFAVMVDKAEPEFRATAESFRALHERHAATIAEFLTARGLPVDAEGSFMGNVNAAVVTVRAFFDTIDADVMAQVRDGEKSVLEAFDTAVAAPLVGTEAMTLRKMRDELTTLIARSSTPA